VKSFAQLKAKQSKKVDQGVSHLVIAVLSGLLGMTMAHAQAPVLAPQLFRPDPGRALVAVQGSRFSVANRSFTAEFTVNRGKFKFTKFSSVLSQQTFSALGEVFVLRLKDGREIPATQMSIVSAPAVDDLGGNERASRSSERIRGKRIAVTLESANPRVRVVWNGILREGSNYLRQEITVQAPEQDLPIAEIKLVAWKLPEVKVLGTVAASPVVAGGIFAGFEHPLSKCSIAEGIATCSLLRELPLRA